MTNANLVLWESVEKTDPRQTKPITGKMYKRTSPKPYHKIYKTTETFGPCGIGWGFKILNERVEDGCGETKVHIAHVLVWYILDGVRGEVEHIGQTMFSGRRNDPGGGEGKPYTDEDAPKKSVTDALIKALSMIGFAGDIFMGRYDDSKYVSAIATEFRQHEATPADPPVDESVSLYVAQTIVRFEAFETAAKLKAYWMAPHQADTRTALDIVNGTKAYETLFNAFVARGKALSVTSKIEDHAA